MSIGVIIAAGGRGLRLGGAVPKQLLEVAGRSLLTRSILAFANEAGISRIVVALNEEHLAVGVEHVPEVPGVHITVVAGGPRRQDSVASGMRALSPGPDLILVHDAARAFVSPGVIRRTIEAAREYGAAVPALAARDTVKRASLRDGRRMIVSDTLPREDLFLAQTPQGFRREVLEAAIALGEGGVEATDEARLAEMAGFDVVIVEGDDRNIKVTTAADLVIAEAMCAREGAGNGAGSQQERAHEEPMLQGEATVRPTRVGFGYDSHRLVAGRPLILGGVRLPFDKGLLGHSDADAVAHAVTDAVLGAAAAGDIGGFYPDDDPRWKDADSLALLAQVGRHVKSLGYRVVNLDVTVIAEQPKLAPHRDAIRANLSRALDIESSAVSVKAKTNEGLDAAGRGEAIVVHAVALLTLTGPSARATSLAQPSEP